MPFVDVPFPEEMIESITIGPNCKLEEKDIRELLFASGLENYGSIYVEKSQGSYR